MRGLRASGNWFLAASLRIISFKSNAHACLVPIILFRDIYMDFYYFLIDNSVKQSSHYSTPLQTFNTPPGISKRFDFPLGQKKSSHNALRWLPKKLQLRMQRSAVKFLKDRSVIRLNLLHSSPSLLLYITILYVLPKG